MALGVKQEKIYLNIKEGKVYHKDKPYDYVRGILRDIELRDREFRGEAVKYWYFNLEAETGDIYSIGLYYNSGVAISLINYLASAPNFIEEIKIEAYQKGDFTKLVVYQGGEKLRWKYSELPPLEEVKVGDKIVRDDSKRMELMLSTVNDIREKL